MVVLARLSPPVELHLLRLLVHHWRWLLHGHHRPHVRVRGLLHVRVRRLHVRVGRLVDWSMTLLHLGLSGDDDDWVGKELLVLGMVEEYNFYREVVYFIS